MFNSIRGLYLLDAKSTPTTVVTILTISKHCQVSPGVREWEQNEALANLIKCLELVFLLLCH